VDEQDVVIGVCGRYDVRRRRAQRPGAVDLLDPGVLVGRRVAAHPEAARSARGQAVDVASEDDRARGLPTRQHRPELGALRGVGGDLDGLVGGQMSGAHDDARARGHAHPLALLGAGLRRERVTVAADDRRPGEHRIAEQAAPARMHAVQPLAVVDDAREAQVVPGLARDAFDVPAAGFVDGDRIRMRLTDLGGRRLHPHRVVHPAIAPRQAREAQVHLHQLKAGARQAGCGSGRSGGTSAARHA
jgi:hypothetical protein